MPYYQDNHIRIFNKDCRHMDELPDESVQCVVTSPPYWGLRKYSGAQELIWGGDNHCEHEWVANLKKWHGDRGEKAKLERKEVYDDTFQVEGTHSMFCSLCGAWKGAYGLELTPEMYIKHTIEILREIRRVLRKDGVVFWNIGDSYAGSGSPGGDFRDGKGGDEYLRPYNRKGGILKPKDMCLVPFHIAIEAQRDGWWVRSVIIWSKPNPMPSSVNGWRWERHRIKVKKGIGGRRASDKDQPLSGISSDSEEGQAIWKECPGCPKCLPNDGYVLCKGSWRPTESHEYLLMLTKADTYYCDAEAVREPYSPTERWGGDTYRGAVKKGTHGEDGGLDRERSCFPGTGRNLHSVWEFPTEPFPSFKIDGKKIDHFAVFPEKLPELCIKAATPEVGCCSKCGAPWARIIDKEPSQFNIRVRDAKAGRATPEEGYKATEEEIARYPGNHPDPGYSRTVGWQPTCKCPVITEQMKRAGCDSSGDYSGTDQKNYGEAKAQSPSDTKKRILKSMREPKTTLGWEGTCDCEAARVPSLVLDPLMGAGTTLWVAKKLNRKAVGYELSQEYCQLALERNRQMGLDL